MVKILFIVRSYSCGGAQPLRFRNIVNHLAKNHQIHILEFGRGSAEVNVSENVTLFKRKYSKLGKLFNGVSNIGVETTKANSSRSSTFLLIIFRFFRSLFFPDPFIIEYYNLKKNLECLIEVNSYDCIVGSGFPHTVLMMSSVANKKNVPFIYDIGDPFYGNAKNSWIRNIFAKKFENFYLQKIKYLIVTNSLTKEFYYNNFPFLKNRVKVVEQGIIVPDIQSKSNRNSIEHKSSFNLLYAGQFYSKLREPFNLYHALSELNTGLIKYHLSIYGNISELFKDRANKFISYFGYANNDFIWNQIHLSDAIVFIDNAYGMQTPGKVFEVIASQKPVLFIYSTTKSPAYKIAREYPNIFFALNNKGSIMNVIKELFGNSKHSYSNDVECFSWSNRAADFEKVIFEAIR